MIINQVPVHPLPSLNGKYNKITKTKSIGTDATPKKQEYAISSVAHDPQQRAKFPSNKSPNKHNSKSKG